MTTVARRPYGREQEPEEPELATLNPGGDGGRSAIRWRPSRTAASTSSAAYRARGSSPGIVRYRRKRRRYVSAIVTEVVDPSPHRVDPPCPWFGPCSGCQWQHIDYSHQLDLKRDAVRTELEAYAPSACRAGIRRRSRLPSGSATATTAGSRYAAAAGSASSTGSPARFVDVDRCMLMADGINDVLSKLDGPQPGNEPALGPLRDQHVRSARAAGAQQRGDTAADRTDALHGGAARPHLPDRVAVVLPGQHRPGRAPDGDRPGAAGASRRRDADRRLRRRRDLRGPAGSPRRSGDRGRGVRGGGQGRRGQYPSTWTTSSTGRAVPRT